uniref:Uncharacterized protein n=1 Tax=Arundo donax TaxID=35708 RepID=A0A0A8Y6H3_ARUDO
MACCVSWVELDAPPNQTTAQHFSTSSAESTSEALAVHIAV